MRGMIAAVAALALLSGCSPSFQRWQYSSAVRLVENKKFSQAVDRFSRVVRRAPDQPVALEASRRAARIATFETKNYSKAAEFYRHMVLHSPDSRERLAAQKSLAEIYSDKLGNYDQAVVEYSRLIALAPVKERAVYQMSMAKAHMNLNNFSQALIEIEDLLSKKMNDGLRFEALEFKGNLLQAAKRLDDAIKVFEQLMKEFPQKSQSDSVGLSLAVCLEEKGDFKRSIEVLEQVKEQYPTPDFIQARINRLKDRMANMPGAQGFKR
jgi:tetratricopeptide (TPR) repeat protein